MIPKLTLPLAVPAGNGLIEGESRRDRAHHRLDDSRSALIRRIRRAFLTWLLDRGPATTDAVRILVPIPLGIDPRVVGAAVRSLALDRIIVAVGRERTRRAVGHARWIDVWTIRDREVALRWLSGHPDSARAEPMNGVTNGLPHSEPSLYD